MNVGSWPNGMKLGRTRALFHGVSQRELGILKHLLYRWVSEPLSYRRSPGGPEPHHHPSTLHRRVGRTAATRRHAHRMRRDRFYRAARPHGRPGWWLVWWSMIIAVTCSSQGWSVALSIAWSKRWPSSPMTNASFCRAACQFATSADVGIGPRWSAEGGRYPPRTPP